MLPDAVRRILQEEMHLSAKMAHRFGRYFGTGAEYWGLTLTVLGGLAKFECELIRARTGEGR